VGCLSPSMALALVLLLTSVSVAGGLEIGVACTDALLKGDVSPCCEDAGGRPELPLAEAGDIGGGRAETAALAATCEKLKEDFQGLSACCTCRTGRPADPDDVDAGGGVGTVGRTVNG